MKVTPDIFNDDQKLVILAQKDRSAFGLIYDKYFERIYLFIYKRVQDEAVAGDICQEAMLKTMFNIHKYVDRGAPFSAWIYRIASNEVNQYFRKSKKMLTVSINENDLKTLFQEGKFVEDDRVEQQAQLVKGLNGLKPEQAEIIDLRFFMHYSFKEIAEFYNITEANAKMRLYRILDRLKKACQSK